MSMFREFGSAARGNAAPVTTGIVIAIVGCFLISWVGRSALAIQLAFSAPAAFSRPWTFLTYPFANVGDPVFGPISVLFLALWLWGIGGSVERELGSAKYLAVWAVFSFLCAFFVWIGYEILHPAPALGVLGAGIMGGWPLASAITVIWATRNPDQVSLFMFVLQVKAKWIAWIACAFVFFATEPPLAPFAAIPFAFAYFWAANKIKALPYGRGASFTKPEKKWERYDKSYYTEVAPREKEREEKERLRKLFEDSLDDEERK